MFGDCFKCSACDFDWGSGWSHHEGGQLLICRSCGTRILAGDGASCWGPTAGEKLQIFYQRKNKWKASGEFITARANRISEDGVFRFTNALKDITCPKCHAAETVTDDLQTGEVCPQCQRGTVQKSGSCIY